MCFLLRVLAEQWLRDNNKVAFVTHGYGPEDSRSDGRWYLDTLGNRRFFKVEEFPEEERGLLPPEIYYDLPFQRPAGWDLPEHYPWFHPYAAAYEAAIVAVAWNIYERVYRADT